MAKLRSFIKLPFGSIVLSLLVVFVMFQFFLQGSIGIMSAQVKHSFHIDAAQISILSSAFFYSYILLQIPAGILIDTFGIKKCVIWAVLLMSLGCFSFAFSNHMLVAILSRIFMGIGASFGFLSMLKCIKLYFDHSKFPIIMSLTELFSTTGVALFNYIISILISLASWQIAMSFCGLMALCLALLLYVCFKYETKTFPEQDQQHLKKFDKLEALSVLKKILKMRYLWLNGIFSGCLFSIITVFVALWGVPYIKTYYTLDNTTATSIISFIYLGVSISSPLIGILARQFLLTHLIRIGAILSLIVLSIILYYPPNSLYIMYILMFLLGAFCSSYQLSFSLVSRHVNNKEQGSAVGLVNMLCMLSAPLIQPIIGILLSSFQNGIFDGYEEYTIYQYKAALSILPFTILIGLFLSFVIKEYDN